MKGREITINNLQNGNQDTGKLLTSKLYTQSLARIECAFLRGRTILVTGATGMIGSCLIDALVLWNSSQSVPCQIVAVSRTGAKAKKRFAYCWNNPNFTYVEQDVCAPLSALSMQVDYIVHAASNSDPIRFAASPVDTLLANVTGTNQLLNYGIHHGMRRFLYVSSGEVYGQPDDQMNDFLESYCGPVDLSPRACYPVGKRAAEVLCQSYISQYQTDAVIVRPCHVFGPTMTANDSRAVSEFLRCAALRQNIVMKSEGLLERSHCYVIDVVAAILKVLSDGICGEAYNIADRQYQMTIRMFAQKAADAGGTNVIIQAPNETEKRGYSKVTRAVLNASKIEHLGWRAGMSAESAITETVEILQQIYGNE